MVKSKKKGSAAQVASKTGKTTAAAMVSKTKPTTSSKEGLMTRPSRPGIGAFKKGGATKRKCGGKS